MSNEGAKDIASRLASLWAEQMEGRGAAAAAPKEIAETARAHIPVIWLLGKVQSGKSSIVQAITGATAAEVGSGFRSCTRTARVFDFPEAAPILRFLDTRGLGEAGYDPGEDLAFAESTAHLLLVVMRASDHQQDEVLAVVRAVRQRQPDWPIVVAQTCLHDAYRPGAGHPLPYPFAPLTGLTDDARVPATLTRSLAHQRGLFDDVGGRGPVLFAPIDFTTEADHLEPRHYGLDVLRATLAAAAPSSLKVTLEAIGEAAQGRTAARAQPTILWHAGIAAAADLVPMAGAVAVPGIQARLLHALATEHDVAWDRRALTEFGACLGAGILARIAARFGIRQLVKLVPVYGQTIGAAAAAATSFATTYALGHAAIVFLDRRKRGLEDPEAVADAYRQGLEKAFGMARERGLDEATARPAGDGGDARR